MKDAFDKDQELTTADIARTDGTMEAIRRDRLGARGATLEEEQRSTPLFSADESQELRSRWDAIQTQFVDEPRKSVQEADALVAGAIKRLAEIFAQEHSKLEGQSDRGDNVSTEDLRLGLQRTGHSLRGWCRCKDT